MLIAIVCFALIKTRLQTFYLAVIPIILWVVYTKPAATDKLKIKDIISGLPIFLISAASLIFFVELLFFYKYMGITESFPTLPEIHSDYVFHSNIAAHLNENGYENAHINSDFSSMNLYHYAEGWLCALLFSISKGSYLSTLIFNAFPIIFVVVWFGFAALTESLLKGKSQLFYLSVSSICFIIAPLSVLTAPFSSILKGDVHVLIFSQYYKLSVIYLFVLAVFLVRDNTNNMIFFSILLMLIYPTVLPAITGFIFLLYVYIYFKNKRLPKPYLSLLPAILSSYAIIATLLLTHSSAVFIIQETSLYDTYIADIKFYIVSIINIIGSSFLKIIISNAAVIILAFLIIKRIEKSVKVTLLSFVVLQTAGLLVWAVFLRMPDSVQFWNNIYCPAVNICTFTILILSLSDPRIWVKAISVFIIGVSLYFFNPFEKFYHAETPGEAAVIQAVQKNTNAKFACLRHPSEFSNVFLKNTNFAIPANYISFYVKSYAPISLNSTDVPLYSIWESILFQNTPFGRFILGKNMPPEKLQSDFIALNKINFVIATENAIIPDFLAAITDTTIVDSSNKIKLLVLK